MKVLWKQLNMRQIESYICAVSILSVAFLPELLTEQSWKGGGGGHRGTSDSEFCVMQATETYNYMSELSF